MPAVVINHDLPIASELEGRCEDISVVSTTGREETASALTDAQILVCNPSNWDDRYLEALTQDDWVQTTSAGYDAFPIDEFRDRGVTFTSAAGIHDPVVAEHVFALALSFSRMIPEFLSKQYDRVWGPRTEVSAGLSDWKDDTLTVYGLGSIGEAIAKRGLAFEMDVYGVKRDPEEYSGRLPAERVLAADDLFDVLPVTDLLVAAVPLTEETRKSIDANVFRVLPDSAVFINVARGPVVDETALVNALRTDEIVNAGLDVFESEPLPGDSPLWDRDDVIITPHIGGRSDTFQCRFVDLLLENYGRWQQEEPLRNRITYAE